MKVTVVKRVSLPAIDMKRPGVYYLKILGPMQERIGGQEGEKITVMHAVDLTSGLEGHVVPGTAFRGALHETYPEHAYVGKCFMVRKEPSGKEGKGGKNSYNRFFIDEILDPAEVARDGDVRVDEANRAGGKQAGISK